MTYSPGAQGDFAQEKHENLLYNAATPAFGGAKASDGKPLGKAGYIFDKWQPTVVPNVSNNASYVAQWIPDPHIAYTVEHYLQKENSAEYEANPTTSEAKTGTFGTRPSFTSGTYPGFAYQGSKTTYASTGNAASTTVLTIAADGSLVVRLYYDKQYTVTYEPGAQGDFAQNKHAGLLYNTNTPAFNGAKASDGTPLGKAGYVFEKWQPSVASKVTANASYVAQWVRDPNVAYTVEHYLQKEGSAEYEASPQDTENKTGTFEDAPEFAANTYAGFVHQPDKTGYASTGRQESTTALTIAADGSLVVRLYYDRLYTVTYYVNDGTGTVFATRENVLYGDKLIAPAGQPSYAGYHYDGHWYKSAVAPGGQVAGIKWDFDKDVVQGDLSLYAGWNMHRYTVKFDVNGGKTPGPVDMYVVSPKTSLGSLPPVPLHAYSYAVFDGWNTNKDGSGSTFKADTLVTGDITVYAQWVYLPFKLTFDANGGNNTPTTQTLAVGAAAAEPNPWPVRGGYTLIGWNTRGDASGEAWDIWLSGFKMPASNVTLYAIWSPDTPPSSEIVSSSFSRRTSSSSGSTSASSSAVSDSSSDTISGGNSLSASSSGYGVVSGSGSISASASLPISSSRAQIVGIFGDGPPLVGGTSHWSLVSLLLSVCAAIISVVVLLRTLLKKYDDEDEHQDAPDNEKKEKPKRRLIAAILTCTTGLLTGILFLILDNLKNPMAWINRYTLLIFIVFLVHLVMLAFYARKRKRDDSEYEEQV